MELNVPVLSDLTGEDTPRTRSETSRLVKSRFTIAAVLIAAVILTHILFTGAQFRQLAAAARAYEGAALAARAQGLAVDRLASLRAYVITGDSLNLRVEIAAREQLPRAMDSLQALLSLHQEEWLLLSRIDSVLSHWEANFVVPVLRLRHEEALEWGAANLAGAEEFSEVRAAFGDLRSHLGAHAEEAEGRVVWLQGAHLGVLALELFAIFFVLLRFRRLILAKAAALEDQQLQLEEQAGELEDQAGELEEQKVELEAQTLELQSQKETLEHSNHRLEELVATAHQARGEAEGALRRLDEQSSILSAALDSSPLGFAFFDRELRYLRINRAFSELTGVPQDECEGRSVTEFHPESSKRHEGVMREVLSGGAARLGVPYTAVDAGDADGVPRQLLLSYFPLRGQSGGVFGVGVQVDDVTERRMLEDELRQSQKLEAVGQLAGGVAHDFNNLLTVISGHAELLLAQVRDVSWRDDISQIQGAAAKAAAVTQKLLAFSRKQVLVPRVIDINAVVSELAPMLRRLIRENITMHVNAAPGVWKVRADPTQIETVIVNLVVNARDAIALDGSITVRTSNVTMSAGGGSHAGVSQGEGEFVLLEVSDDGSGMPAGIRKRAFEPFFTTKGTGKGTGLGLATVYGIVKQSGGEIELASEEGVGTTFRLYFPAVRDGGHPVSTDSTRPGEAEGATGGEVILLAEDDPAVLVLARRVLEGLHYRVLAARSGTEALELFQRHAQVVTILVTDVVMPVMGGVELARKVRGLAPGLPVVYISGYTGHEAAALGVEESGAVFLQKPFTSAALAGAVRRAIEGAHDQVSE